MSERETLIADLLRERIRKDIEWYEAIGGELHEDHQTVVQTLRDCLEVLDRYEKALVYIGHFAHDHIYMKSARTLHYDMAGAANEALQRTLAAPYAAPRS